MARSLSKPIPRSADIHIEEVGTSAEEVDLYSIFGVDPGTTGRAQDLTFIVTITSRGAASYLWALSATGGTAVATTTGKKLEADTAYVYEVSSGTRYISIIAAEAATSVEFVRG
jgi:hypothetical protein